MATILRFSQLSPRWQAFVRLCQRLGYGHIDLAVERHEPVLTPAPQVLVSVKLDDGGGREELRLPDFQLPKEVERLIREFDQLNDGTVVRVEVRSGVPRRFVYESRPELWI